MNIKMQVCGLIICILVAIFYFSCKRLRLYKERFFIYILGITIINITFDIGSLIAIAYRDNISQFWLDFICKFYLTTVVWQNWSALCYALADLMSVKKHKKVILYLAVLALVENVLIYVLPIYYHVEGELAYTYGGSVMILYISASLFISANLILTTIFRKRISKRRLFGVRMWMLCWLVAMSIQFFDNAMLVVGFAASLGAIVLFFSLENPEIHIDRQFGCFNTVALHDILYDHFGSGEPFPIFALTMAPITYTPDGERLQDSASRIHVALKFLSDYQKIKVFKNVDQDLILMCDDRAYALQALEKLVQKFCIGVVEPNKAIVYELEDAQSMGIPEEAIFCYNYVRDKLGQLAENNIVHVQPEDIEEYMSQARIRNEIASALEEDRVEVFYQPIYNVAKQRFASSEALVRIRKKDGSLMSPGLFIPVAEDSGQIVDLGQRVFEKTCEFLADGRAVSLGVDYIEVNLSIVQCERSEITKMILDTIQKNGLKPSQINLEITETASIHAKKLLLENMQRLQAEGVRFSLDDFGSGESNLMYVVEMPFQILKLDMSLTKAYYSEPRAGHVLKAAAYMAHEMGIQLVAEGIETQSELDGMLENKIDHIQGYFYSKPLPQDEYISFLQSKER